MYVGVWAGRGVPEAHHADAGSQGDPARFGGTEGLTPGGKGCSYTTQRGGQVEHQDQPAHRAVQQDLTQRSISSCCRFYKLYRLLVYMYVAGNRLIPALLLVNRMRIIMTTCPLPLDPFIVLRFKSYEDSSPFYV